MRKQESRQVLLDNTDLVNLVGALEFLLSHMTDDGDDPEGVELFKDEAELITRLRSL